MVSAPTTKTPEITTTQKTTVTPRPPEQCGANEQLGNCGRICELTCSNQNTNKCAYTVSIFT